jgi:hypothetical protein
MRMKIIKYLLERNYTFHADQGTGGPIYVRYN